MATFTFFQIDLFLLLVVSTYMKRITVEELYKDASLKYKQFLLSYVL